jgi:hypothetical protein
MPFLDSLLLSLHQVLTDDSEVILCDFSDVMEVVTFLNVIPSRPCVGISRGFRFQCLHHLYPSPVRQAWLAPKRIPRFFL